MDFGEYKQYDPKSPVFRENSFSVSSTIKYSDKNRRSLVANCQDKVTVCIMANSLRDLKCCKVKPHYIGFYSVIIGNGTAILE